MRAILRRIYFWLSGFEMMPSDIKQGDWVTHPGWSHGPVKVVDMNFALRAVAIQLGEKGGIVVWPMRKNMRLVWHESGGE